MVGFDIWFDWRQLGFIEVWIGGGGRKLGLGFVDEVGDFAGYIRVELSVRG